MVVVIDFGMVYLGYVFLFWGDFKNDLFKIIVYKWSRDLLIFKILICVLFDGIKKFIVFGYDVEKIFGELLVNGVY